MVLDPPRKLVSVNRMIIYSFIPILGAYAAWRIQKFWVLLGINVGVSIVTNIITGAAASNNPALGIVIGLAISIPITVFVVRHYARQYNNKLEASAPQPPN
jgi:hypothetical protein